MKNLYCSLLLLLALILSICLPLKAQDFSIWEPWDGVPVRQSNSIEFYRAAAVDDQGNTLVVWTSAETGDFDLYAQLINIDGETEWGHSGRRIVHQNLGLEAPSVIYAGDDHWIVAWSDQRGEYFGEDLGNIFIQKFDMDGIPQWEDGINDIHGGIPIVEDELYRQEGVRCFPDENGGVICTWTDNRNESSDIYAQRIDSDGNVAWEEGGIPVAAGPEDQATLSGGGYSADIDGSGGIIVGWVDLRDATDKNLFAQRVDADGNLLWSPDGIPEEALADTGLVICGFTHEQTGIKLCPDGVGGAFFAWQDKRTWFEDDWLYGDPLGNLYIQRVDADGNLLWTVDGEVLCDAQATQFKHRIVNTAPGEAIVIWEDQRTDWFTSDLYMQKISGTNELELNWGDVGEETLGIVLCDEPGNQFEARLTAIGGGDGGMVVSWTDERENEVPREDLYADRIDEDGNHLWSDGSGIIVSDAQLQQTGNIVRILDDGNDTNAAIVWFDYRDGSPGIYYQVHELEDGAELVQENGAQIIYGIDFNAENPQVIFTGTDLYIGWEDKRFGRNGKYPFIQKLNPETGEILGEGWPYGGISLTPGFPEITEIDTAKVTCDSVNFSSDEQGEIFAAWHDDRYRYHTIIAAQKMNANGELLWGNQGVVVAEAEEGDPLRNQERPRILPAHDGGAHIVFLRTNQDWWVNIHYQRLGSTGHPLWYGDDNYGLRITDEENDHTIEDFIFFPNGNILLVFYTSVAGNNYDLFAHCIDPDGNFPWGDPIPISQADGFQYRAKAQCVSGGILVVWEDSRAGSTNFDLYGQIIREDGTFTWDEEDGKPLVVSDESLHKSALGVASDTSSTFWLTWRDLRGYYGPHIFCQRIDINGQPLFDDPQGYIVCETNSEQNNPKIVVGPFEDAYITWQEIHADIFVDLYYTHIGPDGLPLEPYQSGFQVLCNEHHQQIQQHMVSDGNTGFFCTWEDLRISVKEHIYNIYAQRVDDGIENSINEKVVSIPEKFELLPPYPNPFNPEIVIPFQLPERAKVILKVFNILGKEVTTLTNEILTAGKHRITWDGKDMTGRSASSGIYFVKLETHDLVKTRKIVLLK